MSPRATSSASTASSASLWNSTISPEQSRIWVCTGCWSIARRLQCLPRDSLQSRDMEPLRVLMLEDAPTDAELIEHEPRRSGVELTSLRVDARSLCLGTSGQGRRSAALDEIAAQRGSSFDPDVGLSCRVLLAQLQPEARLSSAFAAQLIERDRHAARHVPQGGIGRFDEFAVLDQQRA